MNLCNPKQKAFAQRVYFDLKICRKWSKLNVYFDETNKWIFFLGKQSDDQPLVFVLPMSCDEQLSVDDLFNLKSKLSLALPSDITENIESVLMAIIANDFTLGYFNFTLGLPIVAMPEILQSETSSKPTVSMIDNEFTDEIKNEITDDRWTTTNTNTTWD
ncbi:unnamed protein product [Adineta steineri]|uniref:tRNA-splicing endonuclease subunit Sen15 domain-containing protein n=1 Tax=Adineta steineri TaxID=433720 RepID=A0A813T5K9_9BILA|nr:unnamed protein product [Adineta steineri]